MGRESSRQWHTYVDHRPLKIEISAELPDTENGYATLLGIGYLALYVFARDSDEPPEKSFPGDFGRAFRQIWPVKSPTSWPPDAILTPDGMDQFVETIGTLAP